MRSNKSHSGLMRLGVLISAGLICIPILSLLFSGCGEKIAIPVPSGEWANLSYSPCAHVDRPLGVSLCPELPFHFQT